MRRIPGRRDERGSIPIFLGVMVVATAMIITTVEAVDVGLKQTRRAGDSANALQVADAGVNDAIQQAPTVPKTTLTFTRTGTLGSSGSYTYTAARDTARRDLWHIDVLGTDKTGVRRRIKADALPSSLFNSPLFVNSTLDLSSGVSLDSFTNGVTKATMCTGKGIIGTNSPTTMTFGSVGQGQGVNNCKKLLGLDPTWDFSMDGCTSFGDGSQALPPIGTGKCPPAPDTFKTPPKPFTPATVYPPGTPLTNPKAADYLGTANQTLVCDPSQPASTTAATKSVQSLVGGKIYYFKSIVLKDGCTITSPVLLPAAAGGGIDPESPVTLYADTRVDIGNPNGQGGAINKPPQSATVCGNTSTSTVVDGKANPAYYYCPLWTAGLRIRMISGASNLVNIRSSGTKFWGSIEVPTGTMTLTGSQIEIWGAAASNTASSNAQFTWHFDDSLVVISNGQYGLSGWREEPLPS